MLGAGDRDRGRQIELRRVLLHKFGLHITGKVAPDELWGKDEKLCIPSPLDWVRFAPARLTVIDRLGDNPTICVLIRPAFRAGSRS